MVNEKLHLSILCPEKTIYDGDATRVTLPGSAGAFTILPHHAAIVSSLRSGIVSYVTDSGEQFVNIENGFVEMSGETVLVCITLTANEN